ncbi:hypothetical protein [Pseudovibrio sp. Tun.PSC04-5.I4]|uniref:hypothetical protein n=1 Tax=Pseudovibrio sp. Tun.PSC04-5.I4 TaxID=1798213 RepID=UPI00088BE15D|nr:hypothetical protein [Pseudovibrio sp. Tun.PSC04-5.I4]SDR39005.1 hypothetical protein SAMN04515695_5254 [Pseudovibrio sp. Tun.PSC04-5.I4]
MRHVPTTIVASSLITLLWAASAQAQARPDTTKLTCELAKSLVNKTGGIVLNTGPRTYDRYVSDIRYCLHNEVLRRKWVPTLDEKSCQIGYSCSPRTRRNQ